jgi:predicted small secreted protein
MKRLLDPLHCHATLICHSTCIERRCSMHQSKWIKRIIMFATILFAAATPLALSGCNTTQGFGEDVEAAGEAIEDTANDASN